MRPRRAAGAWRRRACARCGLARGKGRRRRRVSAPRARAGAHVDDAVAAGDGVEGGGGGLDELLGWCYGSLLEMETLLTQAEESQARKAAEAAENQKKAAEVNAEMESAAAADAAAAAAGTAPAAAPVEAEPSSQKRTKRRWRRTAAP